MLTDSTDTEILNDEKRSSGRKLVAAACALLITAALFAGYTYLRKRHTQQMLAGFAQPQQTASNLPKGPPKAHILVDDALLKAGHTLIGGTVKNTSSEKLSRLAVGLELRRRKDGSLEQTFVPIEPSDLEPEQEGRYAIKLPAQQYISVRLVGLQGGADPTLLAYTTSQGQKRPAERLEPKVVTVPRPGSRGGEFLNSPENPARVP
ncbi:MAG: hypothetical protein ACREBG_03940 [Pyrinomonadaceae bacterium]